VHYVSVSLDAALKHLLLSRDAVPSNGLDTFVIKDRLEVIRSLVLCADVSLFRLENTGEVDLRREAGRSATGLQLLVTYTLDSPSRISSSSAPDSVL
jgi:hypothetical protein